LDKKQQGLLALLSLPVLLLGMTLCPLLSEMAMASLLARNNTTR
jgi:hypothetical protein